MPDQFNGPAVGFLIANLFALFGWALLVIAIVTKRSWLRNAVAGTIWPLLLAVLYVVATGLGWGTTGGGISSIEAVREHLSGDWPLVAGWVHYLAFDLFIGAWIAADAERAGLPRLSMRRPQRRAPPGVSSTAA